jgi:hypothetical protein
LDVEDGSGNAVHDGDGVVGGERLGREPERQRGEGGQGERADRAGHRSLLVRVS